MRAGDNLGYVRIENMQIQKERLIDPCRKRTFITLFGVRASLTQVKVWLINCFDGLNYLRHTNTQNVTKNVRKVYAGAGHMLRTD